LITYYNAKEVISTTVNYKKNKIDGSVTYYYENGKVQFTGNYENGKMSGVRLGYDKNGKPLNGKVITKDENSESYREATYINGKPEGK
jgi:antitoxin component YwqK of YwqJK toxin-antitoxin module